MLLVSPPVHPFHPPQHTNNQQSVAFRSQDRASGYRPGLWTAVAAQMVILIVGSFLMFHFRSENRKVRTEGKVLLGTNGFLYTL